MADILISGGLVGTQDAERRVFADGAVAIEGNRIVAVGPRKEVEAVRHRGGDEWRQTKHRDQSQWSSSLLIE